MPTDLISKAFLTVSVCVAVESPPAGAEINISQIELGIMVEDITPDSRFDFTDVVVMVNKSQPLTHFYRIKIQIIDGLLVEVNVCA